MKLLALSALNVVYGMVLLDGLTLHLDHLLQKSLRYKHHKENYIRSLNEGIVPVVLHLNKKPAFVPVLENFKKNYLILRKIISFWKRNMIIIEATLKRDVIGNGKSSKRDISQIR